MLDFLFGKKKQDQPAPAPAQGRSAAPAAPRTAPGTTIGYHPGLVDELEEEHRRLLRIFADTRAAFAEGDLAEVAARLEAFHSALAGHLIKEKVRLYVYLEHALAADSPNRAVVRRFRHEMEGIGKTVLAFLDRYRHIAADPALAGDFGADLAAIGEVLVARIGGEEETLYPLYAPLA